MAIKVVVAGMAMPTSISKGTIVQAISTLTFSWKFAGLGFFDFRCRIIEINMRPNTTTPITQQM
jgi:hypothetical protein